MNTIFSSASKIVFIMMAVGVNVMAFWGKINPEQYMMLAGMAFTFYFANKGEAPGQVNTQTTMSEDGSSQTNTQTSAPAPFAGK